MVMLATMVLLYVQAAPTMAAIKRLSPEAAGNIALAGKEHRPIVEVIVPKMKGPEPRGFVELEMLESALPTEGGCVRRRWTVNFYGSATAATEDDAKLSDARAGTEVALRRANACPSSGYVTLNGGLETAQAIAALAYLEKVRLRRVKAVFSCSDSTATNLCASRQTVLRGLAKVTPWTVMRERETTTFWLRDTGQVATRMSYTSSHPVNINITRSIAPPF